MHFENKHMILYDGMLTREKDKVVNFENKRMHAV